MPTYIQLAVTNLARKSIFSGKGGTMMPLSLAAIGQKNVIRRIGGNAEIRSHLEHLGFVPGGDVTIITAMAGNQIVNVKDSRVAISREMAGKIWV